jgi:hypothetical protein
MPPFFFATKFGREKIRALAKFLGTNGRHWRLRDVKGVSEEKSEETNLTKGAPRNQPLRGALLHVGKHRRWRTGETRTMREAAFCARLEDSLFKILHGVAVFPPSQSPSLEYRALPKGAPACSTCKNIGHVQSKGAWALRSLMADTND